MKILVTGANGYIGHSVVRRLLDEGHQVVASDFRHNHIDPRAVIIDGDIFKYGEEAYNAFGRPDACIHFCWRNGFEHNSINHIADISNHFAFLTNLVKGGLKQMVVMGTMHEVGHHEGKVDETTECHPTTLYAFSKCALREALMLYCEHHHCVLQWLRGYYVVGSDHLNHSIFSKLLAEAEAGKETFPFTSGKNKYDFIDLPELARQISAVVAQTRIDGIINVCSGRPVALGEKVEQYIRDHGLGIRLQYGAYPERPYDSSELYGDTSKIEAILRESAQPKKG